MQPFHTLKINPAGSKASPLSQCGIGHHIMTAERSFLRFGQSSPLLTLLKGLWEKKDFLTLTDCPGFPEHSPSLPVTVGQHPHSWGG